MIINKGTNTCTIEYEEQEEAIKDEITSVIDSALAVDVPNAFFMKRNDKYHRLSKWDGKKHFFDVEKLSFPSGLLNQALNAISQYSLRLDYKINDTGVKPFVDYNTIPDRLYLAGDKGLRTLELRDYQVKAVKNFYKNNTGVINYAVASGKTAVGAEIIKQALPKLKPNQRVAFFTNSSEIFNQSVKNLESTVFTIQNVNAYLNNNPEKGLSLSPNQSICKKIAKEYLPKFKDNASPKKALCSWLMLYTPRHKIDLKQQKTLEK